MLGDGQGTQGETAKRHLTPRVAPLGHPEGARRDGLEARGQPLVDDGCPKQRALLGRQVRVQPVVPEGHRGGHLGDVEEVRGVPIRERRHGAHLGGGPRQHPSIAFEEEQPGKRGDTLERQTALREQLRSHQHTLDDGLVEDAHGSRDQRVAPLAGTGVGGHACANAHQVGLEDEQSRMGGS